MRAARQPSAHNCGRLSWQTKRFLGLETHRESHIVYVRPEQVVEMPSDGVQHSKRYPGGVTLRFARLLRAREDNAANAADTIGEPPVCVVAAGDA